MTEGGNGGPQEGTPRGVAANALHSAMTAARESTAHKGNVIHIGPPNRYGDSPLEVAHAQVRLAGAKNLLPAVVHSLLDLVNSFP